MYIHFIVDYIILIAYFNILYYTLLYLFTFFHSYTYLLIIFVSVLQCMLSRIPLLCGSIESINQSFTRDLALKIGKVTVN